jgi:hypothetical protein
MVPALSAQKPPTGFNFVIFWPMVCTMRQPPKYVPKAIAAWADKIMGPMELSPIPLHVSFCH